MISVLDVVDDSDWTRFVWVAFGDDFLPVTLSLETELTFFYLELGYGGFSWFLLLVLTGDAS